MKRYSLLLLLVLFFTLSLVNNPLYSTTDEIEISLESDPRGIAINPITDIAVVANKKSDTASIIDLNTQTVLTTIPVGNAPKGVAIDPVLNLALVTNTQDNNISIIDLNTHQIIKNIKVGKRPKGIAVNPITHIAFVVNQKDDTVSIIDINSLIVTGIIAVGDKPRDIAIDSGLNLAVVVDDENHKEKCNKKKANAVSIIDLNTYQVINEIPVGKGSLAVDINPETHTAAIANEKDNTVTVIDLTTSQTKTIKIGKHPIDIVINQIDNKAYIICEKERDLYIIDLDTGQVSASEHHLNKKLRNIAVNNFTNIIGITDDKEDSLTLIQLLNPIPIITNINPLSVYRGSSGSTITITGSKFLKTSKTYIGAQQLQTLFIDNHQLQATVPKELLTEAGTYPITVTNPAPDGGTSNQVFIQITNPAPTITAIDPQELTAGTSQTLTIMGTGFFPETEIHINKKDETAITKKQGTLITNTKLQLFLTQEDLKTAGQYEIRTYNPTPGGGYSNTEILTIKPSLEIAITSPQNNETINKTKTIIKGTYKTGTKDIGITVNGTIAEIFGNEWTVSVPLAAGTNTITAAIKDSSGSSANATIIINTNDTTQYIQLSANIVSGIEPLATYFTISTQTTNPIASYQIDYEGDGIVDYTGTAFDNINNVYTQEGIFYPTVAVIDAQGNTYSDTVAITVLSKTELDTLLKSKWEGMKQALANKDVEKALNYLSEDIRNKFRKIFNALEDDLPNIINSLADIKLISVKNNTAKYYIKKLENGKEYAYFIYFVRDKNGIWGISSF